MLYMAITVMTTICSHPALVTPATDWKAILAEPFLLLGVSAFWLVTLPFAAVALLGVKVWDGAVALTREASRKNPLILRRGRAPRADEAPAHRAAKKA
jgi:hypothetical protein